MVPAVPVPEPQPSWVAVVPRACGPVSQTSAVQRAVAAVAFESEISPVEDGIVRS